MDATCSTISRSRTSLCYLWRSWALAIALVEQKIDLPWVVYLTYIIVFKAPKKVLTFSANFTFCSHHNSSRIVAFCHVSKVQLFKQRIMWRTLDGATNPCRDWSDWWWWELGRWDWGRDYPICISINLIAPSRFVQRDGSLRAAWLHRCFTHFHSPLQPTIPPKKKLYIFVEYKNQVHGQSKPA